MTSLDDIKQIDIMTFDLRGQGGQIGGQNYKNQFWSTFLKFDMRSLLVILGLSKP